MVLFDSLSTISIFWHIFSLIPVLMRPKNPIITLRCACFVLFPLATHFYCILGKLKYFNGFICIIIDDFRFLTSASFLFLVWSLGDPSTYLYEALEPEDHLWSFFCIMSVIYSLILHIGGGGAPESLYLHHYRIQHFCNIGKSKWK